MTPTIVSMPANEKIDVLDAGCVDPHGPRALPIDFGFAECLFHQKPATSFMDKKLILMPPVNG